MKKLVLVVVAFAAISFATTSCDKTQKSAALNDSLAGDSTEQVDSMMEVVDSMANDSTVAE